eukprot:6933292-Karenia_brevis.AAC.1
MEMGTRKTKSGENETGQGSGEPVRFCVAGADGRNAGENETERKRRENKSGDCARFSVDGVGEAKCEAKP